MTYSPMFDMGAGVLAYMYGVMGLLLWGIPAFIIEGFILRGRLAVARPFLKSLIINLVSTIIGYVTVAIMQFSFQNWAASLLNLDSDQSAMTYYEVGPHTIVTFIFVILISWALSVLIEGAILILLEKNLPKNRIWYTILIANIASYIPPAIVIFAWLALQ